MSKNKFAARIGLDWADDKHDYCLVAGDSGEYEYGTFDHCPKAVEEWALALKKRFNHQRIAICLELRTGPIVSCLQKYNFIKLFFVVPGALANYRESFCTSGAKSDPADAFYQQDYLAKHPAKLREVRLDSEDTRILQRLSKHRRDIVEEKVDVAHRIKASLKEYYPLILQVFRELDTDIFCDFIECWPNLSEIQCAKEEALVSFFKSHHAGGADLIARRIELIKVAMPLTEDNAVIMPYQLRALSLVKQLRVMLQTIREYDTEIATVFGQHQDMHIFANLPGAGPALAPRLLSVFGSDRERFQTADEVCRYTAVAPVLSGSGKKHWISCRHQCGKFMRQTFVEWARHTVRKSYWAKQFYEKKKAQGMSHNAILRALAYKWIRILFRCWKNKKEYNESAYLTTLEKRGHKICAGQIS